MAQTTHSGTTPGSANVDDKREINGWAMYDWANSAFSTTVGAVFLGPYVAELARSAAQASPDGLARFAGLAISPESFLPYCLSFSVVLQAGLLPILGAISDYTNRRKQLMRLFAVIGALTTLLMFFVQGDVWWLGGVLYMIANLAFGAALVFYNAFLPEISSVAQRDRVSSFGWAMGYLGGGLLLLLNLILFLSAGSLGIGNGLAVRINLASAGLWWLGWSMFTWSRLRDTVTPRKITGNASLMGVAFKQLSETMEAPARPIALLLMSPLLVFVLFPLVVLLGARIEWIFLAALGPIVMIGYFLWRKGKTLKQTASYLLAYLVFNDGIQTVIGVASIFAAAPRAVGGLEIPTSRLILLILMIQFVAFFGALAFGWLAGRIGSKRALVSSLIIWAGVVIYAYAGMRNHTIGTLGLPQSEFEFWILGAIIALVLGGSQALSRSIFSQMVPKFKEAEFFSIYEISERGTSWLGPFLFGFMRETLGDLRPALFSLILFFVIGLLLLWRVNVTRANQEALAANG